MQTEPRLEDDKAVVSPVIGVSDRLGHQQVLSITLPDENVGQWLPELRSGVHLGDLLPHRQTEQCVGQQEAVFNTGTQEKETIVVAATDPRRIQYSSPGSTVCPDAGTEVTKDNQLICLRRRLQDDVQAFGEFDFRLVRAGIGKAWALIWDPRRGRRRLISRLLMPYGKRDGRPTMSSRMAKVTSASRSSAFGPPLDEGVIGTHLIQLVLSGKPSPTECSDVHLVADQFPGN
ncbi:hypothetical protein SprV_0501824500 [Sparganum proliferum]